MRKIEFRVWDIERKKYIENTGNPYIFPFNGITAMKCAGSSTGHLDGTKDYSDYYILEQFTGLLDKNGKEIYEGSLVAFTNLPPKTGFVIEWDNLRSCFVIIKLSDITWREPLGKFKLDWLEVIGNVHEGDVK